MKKQEQQWVRDLPKVTELAGVRLVNYSNFLSTMFFYPLPPCHRWKTVIQGLKTFAQDFTERKRDRQRDRDRERTFTGTGTLISRPGVSEYVL